MKTDDGKLNYDYDPDTSFLVGDEKLNSWLSDHKNNVMENGTNVQEEEAVADLTSVQETEGETEENTTEAAVEAISVETPQAGTIAEGAANQAAATVVYEGHTYAKVRYRFELFPGGEVLRAGRRPSGNPHLLEGKPGSTEHSR